ncbi:hypothetical protein KIW84_014418 [Lathyrus oleraceus]|uniref:Uncharacterized protein n=1 Tax=Pisum sativum TaxID=3888 RepID=A0A9D5BMP5_PEA|nr:hypothetical protein KIW84_014418 [Pisum sativum]
MGQAQGSLPSKFDNDYAYVLGHICYHILAAVLKRCMATATNLKNPINKWKYGATPISSMMTVKCWSPNLGATEISPELAACAAELSSLYPDYAIGYGAVCHFIASSLVLLARS